MEMVGDPILVKNAQCIYTYQTIVRKSEHVEGSRFPCCILLALSWNKTNKNPSRDKLSRAINYVETDPLFDCPV